MHKIHHNHSLRNLNTFGVDVKARLFCSINSTNQLIDLISAEKSRVNRLLILGAGSNILFTKDFDGLVIKTDIKGIEVVKEDEAFVFVKVSAGEIWHDLVLYCLQNNWGGVENLSLIPGTVGAAPIQNIGAYGVEISSMIHQVEGIDLKTGLHQTFSAEDCRFKYRDSIFKNDLKEKIFISSVTLRLTKKDHALTTSYGALKELIEKLKQDVTIQTVSDTVIQIRQSKLPDPAVIGNAGSFFKNPVVDKIHFEKVKKNYSTIPSYNIDNQSVKIPAAWLIEQAGFKGKQVGKVMMHDKQALVLVNRGGATGGELLRLSQQVQDAVHNKFSIKLEPEVNII